jgi:AcrR family transcriptional regulator
MNVPSAMGRTQKQEDLSDRGQQKREEILEAALELFAERGFHGTAVPLVAEKAGVGAGTIYRYFESKEALVNALYQREKQRMLDALLRDFPFTSSAREQFRSFFIRMAHYAKAHPRAVRFMELHHHAPYLDPKSRELEEHGNALMEGSIKSAIAQEVMKDLPSIVLVSIVWGVFLGLLRSWTEGRIQLDDETLRQAEQCCWEAIRR